MRPRWENFADIMPPPGGIIDATANFIESGYSVTSGSSRVENAQIAQFAPARVDDLVRARGVAGRRADHVALTDGKDFVADPVGSLAGDDEEHFLVGVMRMARERLLARRNDMQLTAELLRANDGADPPELGDELLAVAAVAQGHVGDVDDGFDATPRFARAEKSRHFGPLEASLRPQHRRRIVRRHRRPVR